MSSPLPSCALIDVLAAKANARVGSHFDYLSRLRDLRERVRSEVRSINELFPEYTPHDDEYHLSRLFHVADTLLERSRFEEMRATELFVLAAGLYAHDWGMAVNHVERGLITRGKAVNSADTAGIALLPNEKTLFQQFALEAGLDIDQVRINGLGDDHWLEYVRQTHAYRSAERVRQFLATSDPGVSEAVARVCEAHWLDFELLQNNARFPTNFSVLRESVNLAAVAVYVRLIDLLDIASDRTPFLIWKFVAPRNPRSRMEWAKHRALQPVTCPPYQGGRIVRVDGSTDDHEVYAALEDLRAYCDEQIRGCGDLLARINDPHHRLDLYHLEWRVAARGFEPLPVRFEFARDRIFEILSDEIYKGDAHVFLRELLQNSIDAIRTRRAFLRRGGVEPPAFGLIRVDVQHYENGDARVEWNDNGVGMDIYVVRNYLAVAGRSFYRSDDFKRLGLAVDPISRFGIGVLSCFMVADVVEIETSKDPYAGPSGEPLRIQIPSVTRQFRVEKLRPGSISVGTQVIVNVQGRRLPNGTGALQVTRYLKAVAGFVEFPIVIRESGNVTVIVHPESGTDVSSDPRLRDLPADAVVTSAHLRYPIDEAVVPQDLESAGSALGERSVDLKRDLGLDGIEGRVVFVTLRENLKCLLNDSSGPDVERGLKMSSTPDSPSVTVRCQRSWVGNDREGRAWSRSAGSSTSYLVFRDGVLVAEPGMPDLPEFYRANGFPTPRYVVNLSPHRAPELDVARSELRSQDASWFASIDAAMNDLLARELVEILRKVAPERALFEFGVFLATHYRQSSFLDLPIRSEFPVGFLAKGGSIKPSTWGEIGSGPIRVTPKLLIDRHGTNLALNSFFGDRDNHYLRAWEGEDSLIESPSQYQYGFIPFESANAATRHILRSAYHVAEIEFLSPPDPGRVPLAQEILHPGAPLTDAKTVRALAKIALNDPFQISARERSSIGAASGALWSASFVSFPSDLNKVFRAGSAFNLMHPLGDIVFRCIAFLVDAQDDQNQRALVGRLRDALELLNWQTRTFSHTTSLFLKIASDIGLPSQMELSPSETVTWTLGYQEIGQSTGAFGWRLQQDELLEFVAKGMQLESD